jgi:hypothetical protein
MTNEMREWLDTIEPVDTTPTRERLEAIREQAREEVKQENERMVENGTTHSH